MRIPGRVLLFIPREAVGYSVELFGLSVFPSVRPSVRLSVCPHPWRGPLRYVCGHTYHRTTMIHTFLECPSDLDVRNWRPKVHYMALSCSRRGPLRYVCGQTIQPTAMICTFLERPTDLDVHLNVQK